MQPTLHISLRFTYIHTCIYSSALTHFYSNDNFFCILDSHRKKKNNSVGNCINRKRTIIFFISLKFNLISFYFIFIPRKVLYLKTEIGREILKRAISLRGKERSAFFFAGLRIKESQLPTM